MERAAFNNTIIGASMFEGNISLTDVNYTNVVTIGSRAFFGSAIKDPELPNTLTTIGQYAFAQCPNLRTVIIPDSVTTIGLNILWDNDIVEFHL